VSRPTIPDLKLRLGSSEEVREWNKMREAIISLARHPEDPPRIHPPRPRQFQLFQDSDNKIRMRRGTLLDTYRANDGATPPQSSWYMISTEMGGATDDPPIALSVSASTTYGLWLQFTHGSVSKNSTGEPRRGDVGFPQMDAYSAVTLIASSSRTTNLAGDALVADGTNKSFIFMGTAVVDGNTVATITQTTFGPLHTPAITYLGVVISGSTPNLEIAADGGLKVLAAKSTLWDAKAGPVDTGSDVDHTHT
jgi:hypothetical protein